MKLMWIASENTDLIDFELSKVYNLNDSQHNIDKKHIPSIYQKDKYEGKKDCLPQTYKYMLTLDGWVSAWERGP